MMGRIFNIQNMRRILAILFMCMYVAFPAAAQDPVFRMTVKNSNMYIELDKRITERALDSFVRQFDLGNLMLNEFLKKKMTDSLYRHGWKIEVDSRDRAVFSKPLKGFDKIKDPGEKIVFTEKRLSSGALFPAVSSNVSYGVNRFRGKNDFLVQDSVVIFYLKGNLNARNVLLAGSFTNWGDSPREMIKTDSGWIAPVVLKPGKYWYKFIVDGKWIVDNDNRTRENDGEGNMNSVYFKPNYVITLDSFTNARRVSVTGSFSGWRGGEIAMQKTSRGWQAPLYLADGTHTYRFIVDGKWMADPFNPEKVPNEYGEYNSVITMGKPYLIRLDGYTDARQVILTGSFNGWRRDELFMTKKETGWELLYHLAPGNYEYQFIVDGKRLGNPNGRGNLVFNIDPNYTFRLNGFANAKSVFLAGDFNNWSPDGFPMEKIGDEWVLKVHLSPGKHLYKYIVDGKWIIDPTNKLWEQNEHGTGNSVIWLDQD